MAARKSAAVPFLIACATSAESAANIVRSGDADAEIWFMSSERLMWFGPASGHPELTLVKFEESGNVWALMPRDNFAALMARHGYDVVGVRESLEIARSGPKAPPRKDKVLKPL
jgi:hypothetical protein